MIDQLVSAGIMSGLYGLLDLGGRPLDPDDLSALHLPRPTEGRRAVRAIDAITPSAAHVLTKRGRTTAFLGRIDERDAMTDRLDLPRTLSDVALARSAFDRFGADTPAELLGDWIMLDVDPAGVVSMLVAIGGRMPLLYSRSGGRIAIAPSIHVLSRVGWIGRAIDDDAFLLSLTIYSLDARHGQQTILRGVRRVPRGGCVTIKAEGEPRVTVTDPFVRVPRWSGDRRDAMAEAESLFRRIVRERFERSPSPGLLLSGGLDSSLIAWTLAAEGASMLPALSSAVAPGRGVDDETPFAAMVADSLGLPLHRVVPSYDANVYRPTLGALMASNVPPLSPRDYLYAAFADEAAALGVTELFDGGHGELTFTALMEVHFWHGWPRRTARLARNLVRARLQGPSDPVGEALVVALAPHRRLRPAAALLETIATQVDERWARGPGEPWGYSAGARAPLSRDVTEVRNGRLRLVRPFHDIRLLRLFAGFPSRFMVGDGMTRWPARAMLAGRLPESITRRRFGMPFSPDYEIRLVEQAPPAMARIDTFREYGCDDWFDLEWLTDGLARVASGHRLDTGEVFRVQLTAHACEFLAWWRAG